MNSKKNFLSGLNTILAALLCVVIGLAIGFIILVIIAWAKTAGEEGTTFASVISTAYNSGFKQILLGGFFRLPSPRQIRSEIALAAPLIMCGLSVGFAFKTGLFNIGAAGQYTVGAYGGLLFGLVLGCPWWVCLIASAVFGALWGAIPGFFKAYFNINEVITSIMFNWIGLYGVNTLMYMNGNGAMYNAKTTKTWTLAAKNGSAIIPDMKGISTYLASPATWAIVIAVVIAIALLIILNSTVFGYELKACGHSKTAAKYAGINEKRNIILSMTIAGALAGLGAGLYYLTDVAQWQPLVSTALPSMGFDGISVALLASSNPVGIIFSAFLISHITTGGGMMTASLFPPEIADIISGVIIYLCAFMMLFRNKLAKLLGLGKKDNKGGNK